MKYTLDSIWLGLFSVDMSLFLASFSVAMIGFQLQEIPRYRALLFVYLCGSLCRGFFSSCKVFYINSNEE